MFYGSGWGSQRAVVACRVRAAQRDRTARATHGGFYAHFASRDALLCEALERAGRDSAARIAKASTQQQARGASAFRAFVEHYLSDAHLLSPEHGCPVAALGSEIPRNYPGGPLPGRLVPKRSRRCGVTQVT
jgi:AcrR family transcriptional regulator